MFDKFSRIFECGAVLTCTSIWGKEGKLNIWRKKEESLRDSRNRLTKRIFGSSYSYFRAACLLHHPGAAPRVTGVIFWISVVPTSAGRAACTCALSFRDSPRHSCCGLIASFPGHRVLRPEDACPKRFSWFFYWIPKVQKRVNLVDLVKSSLTRIYLQKSASIQPRTGLTKFAKKSINFS